MVRKVLKTNISCYTRKPQLNQVESYSTKLGMRIGSIRIHKFIERFSFSHSLRTQAKPSLRSRHQLDAKKNFSCYFRCIFEQKGNSFQQNDIRRHKNQF